MREIVIHQMLLFFAVFLIGMLCVKQNILRRESLPHLAGLMAKVLLPVMIFSISYFGVTWAMVRQNAVVLLITAGFYLVVSGVIFLTAMTLLISWTFRSSMSIPLTSQTMKNTKLTPQAKSERKPDLIFLSQILPKSQIPDATDCLLCKRL